jgi:hypothetical protein
MRKLTAVMLASAITASAASAAIGASVAYAAALGGAQAPYARAAAVVTIDGTVLRSKGVTGVRKRAGGGFCVAVDPAIDVTKSVPIATQYAGTHWRSDLFISAERPGYCGNTNEIFVYGAVDNGSKDIGFHLVVP